MKKFESFFNELIGRTLEYTDKIKSKKLQIEHILYTVLQDEYIKNDFTSYNKDNYESLLYQLNEHNTDFPLIDKLTDDDSIEITPPVDILIANFALSVVNNASIIDNDTDLNYLCLISSFLLMEETYASKLLVCNGFDHNYITGKYQKFVSKLEEKQSNNGMDIDIDSNAMENILPLLGITEESPFTKNSIKDSEEYFKRYTINISEQVKKKGWVNLVGREDELEMLEQTLYRKDKPNIILVGNQGIGKRKIVEGYARKLCDEKTEVEIFQLDINSVMSNIGIKGQLEQRVKTLCDMVKINNDILFIENIGSICSTDNTDIASLLKPYLEDGSLKIIGTSTFEDYRKYVEKNESFANKFFKMTINDPSFEDAYNVIKKVIPSYEKYFKIKYTKEIVNLIMNLSDRYIFTKHFPDKAIDLIDMVGAYCKCHKIDKPTKEIVVKTISNILNVPVSNIISNEDGIYNDLEEKISQKIIGQDEAVRKVAEAVIISKSGLRESNKTAISLMFKGQPACGKTELCRVLADIMNIPLVRFDMSEFMDETSISKLIGAAPGYKDAGDGKAGNGLLINAIDEHPYCILLLDEIEKAHNKVHNLLLQIMDNGKLTSSLGKSVSFENVFLIMTSNVGAANSWKTSIGFENNSSTPQDKDYEMSFLPEFRNRIDACVTFNNLTEPVLKKICNKFLVELQDLLSKQKLKMKYTDNVIDYIVKNSPSTEGARPLKHFITNNIKNILAKNIMSGKYKTKKILTLDVKNDKLNIGE